MSRKVRNYVSIFGLLCIGAISMIAIDKSSDSFYQQSWEKMPDRIQEHYADCTAPGGINDQLAYNGIVQTYRKGIQTFDNGKGHYATNNYHNQNNRNQESYAYNQNNNPYYEKDYSQEPRQYYQEESQTSHNQAGTTSIEIPIFIRIGLILAIVYYLVQTLTGQSRGKSAKVATE